MKKKILFFLTVVVALGSIYFFKKSPQEEKNNVLIKPSFEEVQNTELFGKYYSKAESLLEDMSLKQKIGQLFFVRYDKEQALSDVSTYYPGGYVLFAKDFSEHTKESMSSELKTLQDASTIPLALAVDEEGGIVTRVSRYPNFRASKFLSPQEIYANGGYDALESTEKEKGELLLSIGLNVNLAPVADVSVNPQDFIYNRSFGKNAKETSIYVEKMVDYANDIGISSCLKHFPGYGNNADTHTGSAVDNRSYESFVQSDFLPFEAGIKMNVPMVLVSHNIMMAVDSNYPSSLSRKVISILRDELHFSGIVITDDLAMGAIDEYRDKECVTCLAVNAGNDVMIFSDFVESYQELMDAVENKKVSIKKINKAVKRVLAWKLAYHMIDSNIDN